jgi:fibronectin-binding autotransporter adhesin
MKSKMKLIKALSAFIGVIALIASQDNCGGQVTNNFSCTVVPGPVSGIPGAPGGGGTGWFPDDRFGAIGGGPEPYNCLSWWMRRHQGNSLDSALQTANSEWIGGGPYGSGDYRGYWIESVFRPSDYGVSGSANLLIFADNNTSMAATASLLTNIGATVTSVGTNPNTVASKTGYPSSGPGTPFTVTINSSYLIGFCHVEDYSSAGISNNDRTIYSFDNGVHWAKGPWVNYGGGSVVTTLDGSGKYSPSGTLALVNVSSNKLFYTTDLQTAATNKVQVSITGPGAVSSGGLIYNRYLQQWVSFYSTSDAWPQVNAGVVASGDLLNFYKTLPYGGFLYGYSALGKVGSQSGKYPTILGGYPSSAPSGKSLNMESGQTAWLYNNSGGLAGRAISFIKVAQQDLTWNGSLNSYLSNAGNWSVSPGFTGSFSDFNDEVNSLTFGGAGGTLTNDIAGGTIRLRGITYTASAGAYTLTGTSPLSMEAYVTTNTTTWNGTVYGITNNSNNVQEIDSPVNVRTAALYLNAVNTGTITGTTITGCALNLTGAIDLMGSGGMVVYGSGVTVLSGGINDSGYKDFSTGNSEYIASANEGRLVKAGTGTLVLSGTGSFTGRTDILGGVLQLNSGHALQNSVVSVSTGSANSLVVNTDATLGGLNGSDNLNLNGHSLTIGNNNPPNNFAINYSGVLSGAGSLVKIGNSSQSIGGANAFTGGISLQAGTLSVPGGSTSLGTGNFNFNGGNLSASGNIIINNSTSLSGNGAIFANNNTVIINGAISGSGSLVSEGSSSSPGAGTLVLNAASTFTGGITVDNLVQISTTGALGMGSLTLNGGTLQLTASVNNGNSPLNVTGTSGTIDTQTFSLNSSGAITSIAGTTLNKLGTGTFTWSGSGTYFGGDLVIAGGTLNYTTPGATTFSSGNITVSGSALTVAPSGTAAASVLFAQGAKVFTVSGSATLNLVQGATSSLTVNTGTLTLGTSALQINVPSGTSTLSSSTGVKLLTASSVSTPAGQIFSPFVAAGDPTDGDDFVTYNSTNGFSVFTGYTTHSSSYSVPGSGSTEVAKITGAASLSANSYAQALEIQGTNTLSLNSKVYTMNGTGGQAGVLLNNGTISGSGSIAFGANQGVIFVGGPSAAINSTLTGGSGVTIAGSSGTQVSLGASNSFSGGLTIDGTKVLGAEASFGVGGGSITLDGQGVLDPSANLYRNIAVNAGGGTIEVDISSVTLENQVTGTGSLHKIGSGTLVVSGSYLTTGATYVDQATVQFNNGSLDHNSGNIIIANGAMCEATEVSGYTIARNIILAGTGVSGQGALLLSGGGSLTGNITLTGDALIGTYSTGGMNLTGLITSSNSNLQFNAATAPLTISGSINLGSGNLTLSGSYGTILPSSFVCTQTGTATTTTIASGSSVEMDGEFSGTANMQVNGILSGSSGTIETPGAVTVNSGGVLIPGVQSAGLATAASVIEIDGNLNLNGGSVLQSYISDASGMSTGDLTSGNGTLLVEGTATLAGTLKLYYNSSYTPASGQTLWLILRNAADGANSKFSTIAVYPAGSGSADATYTNLPDGGTVVINGVSGTIHYTGHNSLDLTSGSNDVSITFP